MEVGLATPWPIPRGHLSTQVINVPDVVTVTGVLHTYIFCTFHIHMYTHCIYVYSSKVIHMYTCQQDVQNPLLSWGFAGIYGILAAGLGLVWMWCLGKVRLLSSRVHCRSLYSCE